MNSKSSNSPVPSLSRAFTAVELLVLLAVISFLGLLMATGLAGARDGSQTVQCLSNHRQLINAWHMYADDNAGRFVENYHGGDAVGGVAANAGKSPWALGWLDWGDRPDNTNLLFLIDERYSRTAKYFNRNPRVYQCPADSFVSESQRARGWKRRLRSYAANIAVGDGNATTGPWSVIYRQVKKRDDLYNPTPANTFVYIEEHPDSMNDPGFQLPYVDGLLDVPANHHNGGCAVTFADGHSEMHHWTGSAVANRASRINFVDISSSEFKTQPGDPDVHWLSFRSPRRDARSY